MMNLKDYAKEFDVPIIQDGGLAFIIDFIQKHDIKDILELGTAIGYSAINMASLNKDIKVDTVERDLNMYNEAVKNVSEANLCEQITLNYQDIKDFKTDKKYDLIFVDAAKGQYHRYMEQFLDNLKDDGYMIFDNMIFHGMIYDVDNIKNRNTRSLVKKIIKFRELVQQDTRFDIIMYDDIGDGILLLKRR